MKTTIDDKFRGAAMVPGTTVEVAPSLTEDERAAMIASLKEAEARIAAGQYVEHDPQAFVARLMEVRAAAILHKKA